MSAVTYIDEEKRHRTFRFDLLEKWGCSQEVASRLSYALDKVTSMISNARGGLAPTPKVHHHPAVNRQQAAC